MKFKVKNTKKGVKIVAEYESMESLAKLLADMLSKNDLSYLRAYLGREALRKKDERVAE